MKFKNIIQQLLEEISQEELTLYHRSPYKFFKFDIQKIGTGTGRQMSGWGLYLSNCIDSVKDYGDNVYKVKLSSGLRLIDLSKPLDKNLCAKLIDSVYKYKNENFDIDKFNSYYNQNIKIKELNSILWETLKKIEPNLSLVSLSEVIDDKNKDAWFYINNYTKDNDRIKYLYNQLNALLKSGVDFNDYGFDVNGMGFLFYRNLSRILGGDKNASMFLIKNNVSGLKKVDSDKCADYIIFDDNLLKIV
jgi:hypothetical protein